MPHKNVESKQGARKGGSGLRPRARTSDRLSTPSPQRQRQQPRSTFTATNVKAVGPPSDSNESDSSDDTDGVGNGHGSGFPQRDTRATRAKTAVSVTGSSEFPKTAIGAKTMKSPHERGEIMDEGVVSGVSPSDEGKRKAVGSSGGVAPTGLSGADATNAGADGTHLYSEVKSKNADATRLGVATTTQEANPTSANAIVRTVADTNATATTAPSSSTTRLAALPVTPTRATRQRTFRARASGNKRSREESDGEEGSPFKEMKRLRMSTPVVDAGAAEDGLGRPSASTSAASAGVVQEKTSSANVLEQPVPSVSVGSSPESQDEENQPGQATIDNSLATPPAHTVSDSGPAANLNPSSPTTPPAVDPIIADFAPWIQDAALKASQGIALSQQELNFLRMSAYYLQYTTSDYSGSVLGFGGVASSSSSSAPQAQASTQVATGSTAGVFHSSAGNFGDHAQMGFVANVAPVAPGQGLPEDYNRASSSENVKAWKKIAKQPAFSVSGPGFGA